MAPAQALLLLIQPSFVSAILLSAHNNMPTKKEALAFTGDEILKEPLPRLQESVHHTEHPSLPSSGTSGAQKCWNGQMRQWSDFEGNVSKHIFMFSPSKGKDLWFTNENRKQGDLTTTEYYKCGEEKGVEGRFNHHVSQVMTAIAHDNKRSVGFGDWRASRQGTSYLNNISQKIPDWQTPDGKRRYPDFCAQWSSGHVHPNEVLFVGEAKADWEDRILHAVPQDHRGGSFKDRTRWFGQIGDYLSALNLQYGFITTYRYTIFLRFETAANEEDRILYYSPPIRYSREDPYQVPTLRQCMWYLMARREDDFLAPIRQKIGLGQTVGGNSSTQTGQAPVPQPNPPPRRGSTSAQKSFGGANTSGTGHRSAAANEPMALPTTSIPYRPNSSQQPSSSGYYSSRGGTGLSSTAAARAAANPSAPYTSARGQPSAGGAYTGATDYTSASTVKHSRAAPTTSTSYGTSSRTLKPPPLEVTWSDRSRVFVFKTSLGSHETVDFGKIRTDPSHRNPTLRRNGQDRDVVFLDRQVSKDFFHSYRRWLSTNYAQRG